LPREHPLVFYSHYLSHLALMQLRIVYWALRINRVRRAIKSDAKRLEYMDLSLTPSAEHELHDLALFGKTRGGVAAVAKKLKEDAARHANSLRQLVPALKS